MNRVRVTDVCTARLRLCVMSDVQLRADKAGEYGTLGEELRCEVGAEWPPENWEPHVFDFLKRQLEAAPGQRAWQRYIVLRGSPDRLVGNCNACGNCDGEAEIGYGVLPAYQRQGIATEAAQALLGILQAAGIRSVLAHTFPHLRESLRVMEKCGMVPDGAGEEGTVRYRLTFAVVK